MPEWLYTAIELWPILSSLTPIILLAGFYWLRTKFPVKEDFDQLAATVEKIELDQVGVNAIVQRLNDDRAAAPTPVQLMAEIAAVEGRVKAVEAGLSAISTQLKTANEYLQILVERGLQK